MTIKRKLISSSILLIVAFLFISIMLWLGYQDMTWKSRAAEHLDRQSMHLQMLLRGLNEVILNEGTPQSLSLARNAINKNCYCQKRHGIEKEFPGG